jgi:hypothetical protein
LLKIFKRNRQSTPRTDKFTEAASLLEKRATKLRSGFRTQVTDPTAELVLSLATFVGAIGAASASADRATKVVVWLTVVAVVVALTNAALVVVQIVEADRAIHMQNAIALNGQVFHDTGNQQIIEAIESRRPILIENRGRNTSTQLDGYLGDLETVDNAYRKRQISEEELCGSYSTTITETFDNPEIRKYLHNNPAYFGGASELADIVKKSKREECH